MHQRMRAVMRGCLLAKTIAVTANAGLLLSTSVSLLLAPSSILAQRSLVDIDCTGYWTPCTEACETSSQRTFQVTILPENNGAPCPTVAPDCQPGEGGTTYLTGCLPSMDPFLQYNRCIDGA